MSDRIFDFVVGVVVTVIAAAIGAVFFGALMYGLISLYNPIAPASLPTLDRARIFAMSFGAVGGAYWLVAARARNRAEGAGRGIVFLSLLAWAIFALFYNDGAGWNQIFQGPLGTLGALVIFGWGAINGVVGNFIMRRKRS